MFCEQAREEIAKRRRESFDPEDVPLFEEHLAGCGECNALYRATIQLERVALDWQDEPVPPWQRAPLPFSSRPRSSFFLTWAPLAACLAMAMFVAMRVEIHRQPGGFVVAFGQVDPVKAEAGLTHDEVTQMLAHNRRATTAEFSRVLDRFRLDSEANIKAVLARYSDAEQQVRSQQFKVFAAQMQNQRRDDLDLIQAHFRRFVDRQNMNASNLENLASYVQRAPERN